MEHIYFDENRRKKIQDKENDNIYEALKEIIMYREKYPSDKLAIQFHIRMLIKLDRLEDVEQLLKSFQILIEESRQKKREPKENLDRDEKSLRYYQFILYLWQQRYEEAMTHFYEYLESIEENGMDTELMTLFCKCQLGTLPELTEPSDFKSAYKAGQIMDYQEDKMLKLIRELYMAKSGYETPTEGAINYFNSDFPLSGENSVYPIVKKTIEDAVSLPGQDAKRINQHFPIVKYVFKYPGCGISNNQIVDYFVVEVIVGTAKVVKMYPSTDCQNLDCYDLTHVITSAKGHEKTRIDRFKERFGLK